MIIEIADILTADEARQCRERLETADWLDGRRTAGSVAVHAKANEQLAEDDPLGRQIGDIILSRLGQSERFMAAALPLKVLPPRFNRYTGNGAYGNHIDAAIFTVPGTPHRIRSDLSATLFFSDPDSYDGGELMIESPSGSRGVKLSAGYMALYPATTLHRVTPVTRGTRYAAFFWIQSLVREENRRAMLLELDDSIRSVAAETPDHPAVVRLTGLYHNLLRDWAQT